MLIDRFTPMKKKLFAFWRYDQFPNVLGGEITDMDAEGNVETANYGKGHWFKPIKIVPLAEGKRLMDELHTLKLERQLAIAKAGVPFTDKRDKLISIPPLTVG